MLFSTQTRFVSSLSHAHFHSVDTIHLMSLTCNAFDIPITYLSSLQIPAMPHRSAKAKAHPRSLLSLPLTLMDLSGLLTDSYWSQAHSWNHIL